MKNSDKRSTHDENAVSEWSRPLRQEKFRKLLEKSDKNPTHRVPDWKGGSKDLKIIEVPIDLPKYRISNGRTISAQQEHVEKHNLSKSFFSDGDPELVSVQDAQHEILKGMIKEEGLERMFRDAKQRQTEAILLDENGFVVNGNRRLCCWRVLMERDSEKYSHFRFIEVAILEEGSEAEINRLEAKLQIEPDIRSEYSWHAEANMYDYQMKRFNKKAPEIAKLYGKTTAEVENLIAKRDLAAEYLSVQGKENRWSLVQESNYAFDSLFKASKKARNPLDKDMFKNFSYLFIEEPGEAGDRLYSMIPKIQEHLGPVVVDLREELHVEEETSSDSEESYFGGGTNSNELLSASTNVALMRKIRSSDEMKAKARESILQTIERESQLKTEITKKNYLSDTLRKGLFHIKNATDHGLKRGNFLEGVDEQISQIRKQLKVIESWLKENSDD